MAAVEGLEQRARGQGAQVVHTGDAAVERMQPSASGQGAQVGHLALTAIQGLHVMTRVRRCGLDAY